MRYCLDTRIRGFLLGAMVGEYQAGLRWGDNNWSFSNYLLDSCQLGVSSSTEWGLEELEGILGTQLSNWDSQLKNSNLAESLILSCLPIGLFCHDNLYQLRSRLSNLAAESPFEPFSWDWVNIFTYILALFLREESKSERLIPLLLDAIQPSSEVVSVMMLIEKGLENYQSTASIEAELNQASLKTHTKMAIALYCLLSSCEDLRLSIARTAVSRDCLGITTIVGALSGAYNGEIAIPLEWYIDLANMSFTGLKRATYAQVLKLADELLASWSGVHMGALLATDSELVWAVASPRIMRPR